MNEAVDVFWREFEELGEIAVRQNLSVRMYREDKVNMAKAWLAHKEHERRGAEAARIEASQAEQTEVASRAAIAAERAAKTAEDALEAAREQASAAVEQARQAQRANRIAAAALAVAIAAAIMSLIALARNIS